MRQNEHLECWAKDWKLPFKCLANIFSGGASFDFTKITNYYTNKHLQNVDFDVIIAKYFWDKQPVQKLQQITNIYDDGFAPTKNKKNLETYVQSQEYKRDAKTVRVYSNCSPDDTKRILKQREPVNIGMERHHDTEKLKALTGHSVGVFCDKDAKTSDGKPFQAAPNTVSVYSETKMWDIKKKTPGTRDVACLSVPAPALDTKSQPHYDYYVQNATLNKGRYREEMTYLANTIVQALIENKTSAFDGKGIKRCMLCAYGQGAFLAAVPPQDQIAANKIFCETLAKALHAASSQLQGVSICMSQYDEFQVDFTTPLNEELQKLGSSRTVTKIVGDIIEKADSQDFIVNAWDPHSFPGNGNDKDRSFDGAMGSSSGILPTQCAWINPHVVDQANFRKVTPVLPELTSDQKKLLPKVNYLLPNILVGGYPGAPSPEVTKQMQTLLIKDLGITNYICLMQDHELAKFTPYFQDAASVAHDKGSKLPPVDKELQIRDQSVNPDTEKVKTFIDKLVALARSDKAMLYLHCWGGNGRTSTIATILISRLLQLPWEEAMTYVYRQYLTRQAPVCPYMVEDQSQFDQIRELCVGGKATSSLTYEGWKRKCEGICSTLRPDLQVIPESEYGKAGLIKK